MAEQVTVNIQSTVGLWVGITDWVEAGDQALRNFVADAAYRTEPYPTSHELIKNLRASSVSV